MRPRRSFLRALAAGLGGALCLSRKPAAAEPSAAEPVRPQPKEPAAPKTAPPDLGAMVTKNFSGRS